MSIFFSIRMCDMRLPPEIIAIGALADPIRRSLYEFVAGRPDAVSREAAAEATGITVHQAKFHLERMVDEGLLVTELRRLSGRSGPGAGRPSKLYRRSPERFGVSLPERRHDLAGEILATAIERSAVGESLNEAVGRAARAAGIDSLHGTAPVDAADAADDADLELATAATALARIGYEPELAEGTVRLRNCPFAPLSKSHTDLICSMNHSYVEGVLHGLGCGRLRADLEPHDAYCCVAVRATAEPDRGRGRDHGRGPDDGGPR